MNLNTCFLAGKLTRAPELRYLPRGTAIAMLSLSITRSYQHNGESKTETTECDVECFGKQAESLSELRAGQYIHVTARLKRDVWEKDGKQYSKLKVLMTEYQVVGAPPTAPASRTAPVSAPVEDSDQTIPF